LDPDTGISNKNHVGQSGGNSLDVLLSLIQLKTFFTQHVQGRWFVLISWIAYLTTSHWNLLTSLCWKNIA